MYVFIAVNVFDIIESSKEDNDKLEFVEEQI